MDQVSETSTATQEVLLRTLLRQKGGLTVEALAGTLNISRNAVRQHLISLERDGLIARGETKPTGGRPEQIYILTPAGMERFPRQYSWLSELLLQTLHQEIGHTDLAGKLGKMGQQIGMTMKAQLPDGPGSAPQITAIAKMMTGIGYEATARTEDGKTFIEAHNCVFHRLAAKNPEICSFDIAMLSASSGCKVEHRSCMMRNSDACRFHFDPAPEKTEDD